MRRGGIKPLAALEPLMCGPLLKRGKHLQLQLPWRPLLAALLRHSMPKLRPAAYCSRGVMSAHLGSLARCAAQCRRHFAQGVPRAARLAKRALC